MSYLTAASSPIMPKIISKIANLEFQNVLLFGRCGVKGRNAIDFIIAPPRIITTIPLLIPSKRHKIAI